MKNRKVALLQDKAKLAQLIELRKSREQIAQRELATHNVGLAKKQQQFSMARSSVIECDAEFLNAQRAHSKRLQSGNARVRELQELSRFVSTCQAKCKQANERAADAENELREAMAQQAVLVQRLKAAGVRHSEALKMIDQSRALKSRRDDSRRESEAVLMARPKGWSNLFTSEQDQNNTE